ncbi:hypothetical protein HDV05_001632 [Chytridiales sp. JEL 0842]|nr:hypothetical protein HDV05_001632 [Chytridiales sp. JEL 0842]
MAVVDANLQELVSLASLPPVVMPPTLHSNASPTIVALQHLPDLEAVVVAFEHGDILMVPVGTLMDPASLDATAEAGVDYVVGTVDSGILAMEWSPDRELVSIVTGKRIQSAEQTATETESVLVMTKNFDVISEVPLHTNETGEQIFVNVGWGKKETQFHGSEGKAAAKAKKEKVVQSISQDDDGMPRISWRGDGDYFICSIIDPVDEKRVLRVYNREGTLQSTSEPVPLLEHALSWRPAGNLIASTQRLPHRHDVVFFERNGLRHGEFTLREPRSSKVLELSYNQDSSILAILISRATPTASNADKRDTVVQLWTMGNYYYYLKQEIRPFGDDPIVSLVWDPESSLRLYLLSASGMLRLHEYVPTIQTSSSPASTAPTTVAVTDGDTLLLTPFRDSNVPPPMCTIRLPSASCAVSTVAFGESGDGDDMAILLADGSIHVALSQGKGWEPPKLLPKLEGVEPVEGAYRQLAWFGPKMLLTVWAGCEWGASEEVRYFKLDWEEGGEGGVKVVEKGVVRVEELLEEGMRVYMIQSSARTGSTLVQLKDGRVLEVVEKDGFLVANYHCTFPSPCPWMSSLKVGSRDEAQVVAVGLSERNRLHIDSNQIATDVTSFLVHDQFLIITTLSHTARFIPIDVDTPAKIAVTADGASLPHDETLRRVERGSKIVSAPAGDMKLVLQMPRGNLETIYPRALVLSSVRAALTRLDFKTAFVLCRKHRIDMNLIVDHDPEAFMSNVTMFITHVEEVDYLNLFITSLRDDDVVVTMYPSAVSKGSLEYFKTKELSKVNSVCEALRAGLTAFDHLKYITTVLTTDAKRSPPDLETAMERVKSLKSTFSVEEAEKALKYLIFLADVDRLYDCALGMYDFQLVVMVAQHSQKDPREYLPFLTELRQLSMYRQRFRIDEHLGRFGKALGHLRVLVKESDEKADSSGSAIFEELLKFTGAHRLYKEALDLFVGDVQRTKAILNVYGDHLMGNMNYEDAGLAYYMANELTKAIEAYKEAFLWSEAFAIANEVGFSQEQIRELGEALALELIEKHRYKDAATVYFDYTDKFEEGVKILTKGSFWTEACRMAHRCGLSHMIEEVVKPGALDACEAMIDELKEMKETFNKQRARLTSVREEKARKQALLDSGEHDPLLDSIDMMSDTSSMATSRSGTGTRTGTSFTGSTFKTWNTARSSKTRRKHERKKTSSRKGGLFEEEFLINSLTKAVLKTNKMREEVLSLIRALMSFGYMEKAKELQSTFGELIPVMKKGMEGVHIAPVSAGAPLSVEDAKIKFMVEQGSLPTAAVATSDAKPTSTEDKQNQTLLPAPVFSKEAYGLKLLGSYN